LIPTLFAVYVRPQGNWLPTAAVVALMADLGVDAQAVRSSITGLKRRGVLRSGRRGSAARYGLAEPTLDLLADGDVGSSGTTAPRRRTHGSWWSTRSRVGARKRHELRTSLTRLGSAP